MIKQKKRSLGGKRMVKVQPFKGRRCKKNWRFNAGNWTHCFSSLRFIQSSIVTRWPEIVGSIHSKICLPEAIRFPQGEKSEGFLQLVVIPAHAPLNSTNYSRNNRKGKQVFWIQSRFSDKNPTRCCGRQRKGR